MGLETSPLVGQVIGCAIDVHRALGPGLLESSYGHCLAHKLRQSGISFRTQVRVPIEFEGLEIDCGYRADLIVGGLVLVELKSVEQLLPIHMAQTLTYLKLAKLRHGLLINFNVQILKSGLRSLLNPHA